MNKREKAIWNIVIGISVVVLFSFTYSLWGTHASLNSKKKSFNSTLKKFKDYDIPSSPLLESVLSNNNISILTNKKNDNKENTVSSKKEFIEYKKVISKKKDLDNFEKKKPFTSIVGFSVKGNGSWDYGERFEDTNNNGVWDEKEFFIDREEKIKPGCHLLTEITGKKINKVSCTNKDLVISDISFYNDRIELLGFENLNAYGSIVKGEEFIDTGNKKWDKGEPFTDIGNGQYDEGEEFTDLGNGQYDEGEEFIDLGNGQYDEGEEFIDLNDNEKWDNAEPFTDLNNNNLYDIPENYEDENSNGSWDEGEGFNDLNGNGQWDKGDSFEDLDQNNEYSYAEDFKDEPDGIWNGEEFIDLGNRQYDDGEEFIDLGNGQYDEGEEFIDLNDNGKWDFVLLDDLKATEEEALEALSSNYFYSVLTNNNKKINVYIKTDKELDEYQINADCFECAISDLEESMNSLEISLKSQREHEFELPETITDPTDLSNVIILPGFEGGYNQSARRNTPRLSAIVFKGDGTNSKVSLDYKNHNYILKENEALEDYGVIHRIFSDYIELKKDNEIKILNLETK